MDDAENPEADGDTEGANSGQRGPNQTTRIVNLALESGARLYHDDLGKTFVYLPGDVATVVRLNSVAVERWLSGLLFDAEGVTPSAATVKQAIRTLENVAIRQGEPITQEMLDAMEATAAILREAESDGDPRRSQAARLVDLALQEDLELFRDEREEAYAGLRMDRRQIWPVGSMSVRRWLALLLWEEENTASSRESLASATNLLSSMALFDGEQHALEVRVAWRDGVLWCDLGDGRAVRVAAGEWRIVEDPPILFRRSAYQAIQPDPRSGGDFNRLFDFVAPTRTDDDTILLGASTLADFVPGSPRPALSLAGPHGSGKTTTGKLIKRVVDPSRAKSVRRVADFRELQLQLEQNWLLNIDNVTSLPSEISDGLAAAITGDSDLRRQLYTDGEMLLLDYMPPMILNGITHAVQRPDLLDRTILVTFGRIPKDRRREEEDLWPEFEAALPDILGGAFDILSKAIALRPHVRLAAKPRMADFAAWGYAIAEGAGWGGSRFLAAYERNISRQHEEAVAASVVAQAVIAFIDERDEWQGPASLLKPALDQVALQQGVDPRDRRSGWPRDPARLSRELRRLAETLPASGVEVTFPYQRNRRSIRLRTLADASVGRRATALSMTHTAEILKQLTGLGVTLKTDGEHLLLIPGSCVPPGLVAALRDHKTEILAHLGRQTKAPPDDSDTARLLAWASEFSEQELVLASPVSYVEAPRRTVTTGRVSSYAAHYLRTMLLARLHQRTGGWGHWTPEWWREREADALSALAALREAVQERNDERVE